MSDFKPIEQYEVGSRLLALKCSRNCSEKTNEIDQNLANFNSGIANFLRDYIESQISLGKT